MKILNLIKQRTSIRKYALKAVPINILEQIVCAGIWGPSLLAPGFQPWKFLVITRRSYIDRIAAILLNKTKTIGVAGNAILKTSSATVKNSRSLIVIFNERSLSKKMRRFDNKFIRLAKIAEVSAISASIQNMILTAESMGIGSCWLDAPTFCEKEINDLLRVKDLKLFAILTLGYPAQKGKRALRKPMSETVSYLR